MIDKLFKLILGLFIGPERAADWQLMIYAPFEIGPLEHVAAEGNDWPRSWYFIVAPNWVFAWAKDWPKEGSMPLLRAWQLGPVRLLRFYKYA